MLEHILDKLGKAISDFRTDFGKYLSYPPPDKVKFITALYKSGLLTKTSVYVCPATHDHTSAEKLQNDTADASSYEARDIAILNPIKKLRTKPILWDKKGNHKGVRNVLFATGHTETLKEEEFQKLQRKLQQKVQKKEKEYKEAFENYRKNKLLEKFW